MPTKTLSLINLQPQSAWADWVGMMASIGCAIHCAAMPLVLAYLPTLGLSWLAGEGFHQWMAGICFGLAAMAFVPGWRKHKSMLPAGWGIVGVVLLTTAAFGLEESCCPSCTGEENTVAPAATACVDCEMCEVANSTSTTTESAVSFASFVTPLGGLLLVVGHVLNHLKSCQCQNTSCCLVDDKT